MGYFSDRERYHNVNSTMLIPVNVWNGVAMLVNSLICNNNFAKAFPRQCQDGNGICGVDEHSLYIAAKSVIPTIDFLPEYGNLEYLSSSMFEPSPFDDNSEAQVAKVELFTYNVLDFIEFIFKHVGDVKKGQYHEYFNHYELLFLDTELARESFVNDVNEIFNRNNVAFRLTAKGEIQRTLDKELDKLISLYTDSGDNTINVLLKEARTRIINPKIEERKIALERLWDVFERVKTIRLPEKSKKDSADKLLDTVSDGNPPFLDLLRKESMVLTEIGNKFQIRHFEVQINSIDNTEHLDYLFFRMYALIHLLTNKL